MKTFTFGKYKGRSVIDVLNENPAYKVADALIEELKKK